MTARMRILPALAVALCCAGCVHQRVVYEPPATRIPAESVLLVDLSRGRTLRVRDAIVVDHALRAKSDEDGTALAVPLDSIQRIRSIRPQPTVASATALGVVTSASVIVLGKYIILAVFSGYDY